MNIIQIGCNDCNDEVFKFIDSRQQEINNVILVDALASCTDIAKNKYAFLLDKISILTCAIGVNSGIVEFFVPNNKNVSAFSSLSPAHLVAHGQSDMSKILSPCLDINDFLASITMKSIDYFFIDTEGLDADILLKMDFNIITPTTIEYEYIHTDGPHYTGEKNERLINKLTQLGYRQTSPIGRFNNRFSIK